MKRRSLSILAVLATMVPLVLAQPSATAVTDPATTHTFWLQGVSTLQNQSKYVYAAGKEADEVGVIKPSTLPPTPTGAPCSLGRNTNPALPKDPCSGLLTHQTLPGNQGCTEVGNPLAECSFSGGSTWYYGFCGQTYGGASAIQFRIGNEIWRIDRMGFPRGRGAWEFNGKMTRLSPSAGTAYLRMYLAAVPNNPDEAAGCDLTNNISSIYFQGLAVVTKDAQPRGVAGKPGWHWCNGSDGC